MGQARIRGTTAQRVAQAKARIDALRPETIICNHCQAGITDIQALDTRGMVGIDAAFSGACVCGHSTLAMRGSPDAVADAMAAWEETIGEEGILGSQPIPGK